ncbi:MAG: hypothetical protein ACOX9C_00210 [Kiritimatiellia bacterium]
MTDKSGIAHVMRIEREFGAVLSPQSSRALHRRRPFLISEACFHCHAAPTSSVPVDFEVGIKKASMFHGNSRNHVTILTHTHFQRRRFFHLTGQTDLL